jgi:hypothetical protein
MTKFPCDRNKSRRGGGLFQLGRMLEKEREEEKKKEKKAEGERRKNEIRVCE